MAKFQATKKFFKPGLLLVALSLILVIGAGVYFYYQQTRVYELTIATSAKGGSSYQLADALARVIRNEKPHINLKIVETSGSEDNARLLEQGKADFGFVQSDIQVGSNVRSIASAYPEAFHLMVPANSSIQKVADIKGKRISAGLTGSGASLSLERVLNYYGFKNSDVTFLSLSNSEAIAALREGRLDAYFRVSVAGHSSSTREVLQSGQMRLIPFDQSNSMRLSMPFLIPATIPAGAYRADPAFPPSDVSSVAIQTLILTNKDVETNLVRDVTEVLFENRAELLKLSLLAPLIAPPGDNKSFFPSIHPGANVYYEREQPSFLEKYSESMAFILTVALLGLSAVATVRSRIAERRKRRGDRYNLEIANLISTIENITNQQELAALRQRLVSIFNEVLEDLNNDLISQSSFQAFTFPWEMAMTAVRHREIILASQANPVPVNSHSGNQVLNPVN